MIYWRTKDGLKIDIQAMQKSHLLNTVAMLDRRLAEGFGVYRWLITLRGEVDRRDNPHRRKPQPIEVV